MSVKTGSLTDQFQVRVPVTVFEGFSIWSYTSDMVPPAVVDRVYLDGRCILSIDEIAIFWTASLMRVTAKRKWRESR